jgi:hypothetical protein
MPSVGQEVEGNEFDPRTLRKENKAHNQRGDNSLREALLQLEHDCDLHLASQSRSSLCAYGKGQMSGEAMRKHVRKKNQQSEHHLTSR